MKRTTRLEIMLAILVWISLGIWIGRTIGDRMTLRIGLEAVLEQKAFEDGRLEALNQ